MAKIRLDAISHTYRTGDESSSALREIQYTFQDGGAYALLGPSGCGKTTLLNIISGLLTPSRGRVFFDDKDLSRVPTFQRHIAQIFQFPVVYDTMTVFDNLAFPLRNQGLAEEKVKKRVHLIAELLDLQKNLGQRAAGLSADSKQKISLGRGLVRENLNIIMFDEPLTVIDPHLKWQLRTKLKELHQKVKATLIYVTHDQTEALTFADEVCVMHEGRIVQSGSPKELFQRSAHTFVGHFIGSPGMNILPCSLKRKRLSLLDIPLKISKLTLQSGGKYELGIRPEFIRFTKAKGLRISIKAIQDLGRYKVLSLLYKKMELKMIAQEDEIIPKNPKITFMPEFTHLYENGCRVNAQVRI